MISSKGKAKKEAKSTLRERRDCLGRFCMDLCKKRVRMAGNRTMASAKEHSSLEKVEKREKRER